ncbi:hypothetical protein F5887DRAFT_915883 [Amanita rubescens]|nr:hypothetical protein F5887DRAFT_915883 [Amanita rubescens]
MPGSYASGAAAASIALKTGTGTGIFTIWRAVHPEKRSRLFGAHDEPEDIILAPRYTISTRIRSPLLNLNERKLDVRPKSSLSPSRTSSPAARSLLPSTYLHRDSFEFAVDDDRSDKEEEVDFYDNEPDKKFTHKSIKRAIPAKVDEENGWTDLMHGGKAVGPRSRWLPSLEGSTNGYAPQGLVAVQEDGSKANTTSKMRRQAEDPYTPAPTRMRRANRNRSSSRAGSPVTSPTKSSGGSQCQAISPSVLRMRSTPSVMTPQMESALHFTAGRVECEMVQIWNTLILPV